MVQRSWLGIKLVARLWTTIFDLSKFVEVNGIAKTIQDVLPFVRFFGQKGADGKGITIGVSYLAFQWHAFERLLAVSQGIERDSQGEIPSISGIAKGNESSSK